MSTRIVIEDRMVNNAAELLAALQRWARIKPLEEICIEEPVVLYETTLTDGSKVMDIHLGDWIS